MKDKKYLYYIPFIILSLPFLANGYAGIVHDKELVTIVSSISIFAPYTDILLYIQWAQDIIVWLLILFYFWKFKPWLLLFAALWPIVPNAMITISGVKTAEGGAEWWEVIFIIILSYISYLAYKKIKELK